jgi:D-xylose transport system ATP-binding protein
VVALVGDNGAGKSTLVKVMSGTILADSGEIFCDGQPARIHHPNDATALGIATVYQDLALCNNLDVVANLFLGHERYRGPVLDEVEMERQTADLLAELAIRPRSLRVPVGSMSGGQRQSVAIARSLLGKPRMVILDEPTAALGLAQKQQVLDLIKRLQGRGLAVVLISHNLAEVFAVSDRIEVLRLGSNVASYPCDEKHHDDVVAAITGARLTAVGPS